jgi:hypothetical protein
VLLKAKDEAQKLLSADPQIKLPENANLRQEIIEIYRKLK